MSFRALVLLGCSVLFSGCIAKVHHTPRSDALQQTSVEEARKEMSDILMRGGKPHVDQVEVTDSHLRYHHELYWALDMLAGHKWTYIPFEKLGRVDPHENLRMFFRDKQGQEMGWVDFSSPEDMERFIDLLFALRDRKLAQRDAARPRA